MSVKIAGLMTLKNHRRFTFLERLLVIGTSLYATFTAGETVSFEVHIHDNESQISTNDTSTDDSVTVYVKVYHNEDPEFVYPWGKPFQIRETASDDRTIQTLEATDLDGDTLEYGIDESSEHPFQVVDGQIKLKPGATLDCETTPSYLLTYLVRDNKDADDGVDTRWDDELTLIMRVTNVDEAGTVTLGSSNPEVNAALSASLTDPDGSITDLTWQWQKADTVDATTWTDISGATGSSYTPVSGDAGKFIRAQASYADGEGTDKEAFGTAGNAVLADTPANRSPSFTEGATTTRSIREDATAGTLVGAPVSATDPEPATLWTIGCWDRMTTDLA